MPRFVRSQLTDRIAAYLRSMKKSDSVTYAELSRIVGDKITSASTKLTMARKIVERENSVVIVPVQPRVGVRRLNDQEIAERLPRWWLKGARNKVKRGGAQSESVQITSLDVDERARFSVSCIQQELAANALSKATSRKLEKVARGTSNDMPAFTAAEWAIALSRK